MAAPVLERSADTTQRIALGAAVGSGALVAVQQRLNGELKGILGDALLTAVVSFLTGLVCIAAYVLLRPQTRRAIGRVRTTSWWERFAGLGGATLVAVGAAAAPRLGVALLTVGLVAGQTGGGVLVDRFGIGPGGQRSLTGPRLTGAVLCLLAVAVSVLGRGTKDLAPVLLGMVVLAGFLTALQQALNGRVRTATGDAGVATLLNFVVGAAALLLGLGLRAALHGVDVGPWPGLDHAYLYLGGPMGVAFVAVAAVVVRTLGVLRLGLAVIAGQLVGAVLLDAVVPAPGAGLSAFTVVGAALTLVAVAVSGRQPR